MKVKLINYTKDALETLLFTKGVRLKRTDEIFDVDAIKCWSDEWKMQELDYMLKTIQSSWEFIDYIFVIEGVSRAFTHQFVRTRTGVFAQQSQRTVDMSEFEYITPKNISNGELLMSNGEAVYVTAMDKIQECYTAMITDHDIPPQDARGILPTNTATNITVKFDLRTLSDLAKKRLCPRTQGEYQEVFKAMRSEVIKVHPYFEKFLRVYCAAVGVCQFPNFKECPIKGGIFNPETGNAWDGIGAPDTLEEIQSNWEKMDFEATPKWKGNS